MESSAQNPLTDFYQELLKEKSNPRLKGNSGLSGYSHNQETSLAHKSLRSFDEQSLLSVPHHLLGSDRIHKLSDESCNFSPQKKDGRHCVG